MKPIIVVLLLLFFLKLNAQKIDSASVARLPEAQRQEANMYLNKANSSKNGAVIVSVIGGGLLIAGVGALLVDFAKDLDFTDGETSNYTTAGILFFSGLAVGLGSIPLWTGIHKNREKARAIIFARPQTGLGPRIVLPNSQQIGMTLVIPIGK